jgi:hypothetical protein
MKIRTLMLATAVLVALVGCSKAAGTTPGAPANPAAGAATNGGSAGGGVDPCSLITTAQASTVLGEPAKDGQPHAYLQTKQCEWDSADGSVAILVYIGGQKAAWQNTLSGAKAAPKYQDVSGLGDAAFTTGFDLHILKGDDMYQIGVSGVTDPLGSATTVAKEALAKV